MRESQAKAKRSATSKGQSSHQAPEKKNKEGINSGANEGLPSGLTPVEFMDELMDMTNFDDHEDNNGYKTKRVVMKYQSKKKYTKYKTSSDTGKESDPIEGPSSGSGDNQLNDF